MTYHKLSRTPRLPCMLMTRVSPYRSDDIHQLSEAMNQDLTTVFEWLKGNKLFLNVAISTKQKGGCLAKNNEELSLTIREERIDSVPTAKHLAIYVDSNLYWKVISNLYHQISVEQLAS